MGVKTLYDIVAKALPFDASAAEFRGLVDEEMWRKNPLVATAMALAKSPALDWRAYLATYPDVSKTGINPILHFLQHGLHEGRRLFSKHPSGRARPHSGSPKVSVIIPNYNNAVYLEKCLNSVARQTLRDIEIIAVDDGSTDDSLAIIRRFAAKEPRLKLIEHGGNKSLHMARKTGIMAASGEFIMFLDADDFYQANACEKAYEAIIKGYDFVCFKINVIDHGILTPGEIRQTMAWFNAIPEGEYSGSEIKDMSLEDTLLNISFCAKIGSAAIYKEAFAELADDYLTNWEDLYEFLAVAKRARRMLAIGDRLYNYNRGAGGSFFDGSLAKSRRYMRMGGIYKYIEGYCLANNMGRYLKSLKKRVFDSSANALFKSGSPDLAGEWLRALGEQFGAADTACGIMKANFRQWRQAAAKIAALALSTRPIRRIGIFYYTLCAGGVQTTIGTLCQILVEKGYEVCLFVEERELAIALPPGIRIFYIASSFGEELQVERHIRSLADALVEANIDLMLHMAEHSPSLVWDALLLKLMNIPVAAFFATNYIAGLALKGEYGHHDTLASLRCCDKVFCLSLRIELYLKIQGIDAVYIPTPARNFASEVPQGKPENIIIVIARLHDPWKRIDHCLKILREVMTDLPDAKMIFVGDFRYSGSHSNFVNSVKTRNLENNAIITGWTETPERYIDQGKVLLSTSYLEGFPNSVAEAQKRGLPVVMYRLDIMMAENNESVIQVPQGDYKAAAAELVRLLKDDALRGRLSRRAMEEAAKYTRQRLADEIGAMIASIGNSSPAPRYSAKDYKTIIGDLAFYAGQGIPAE